MKQTAYLSFAATIMAVLSSGTASAALTSLFLYDADVSTGSSTPATLAASATITDASSGGNNGTVIGTTVSTVEDDPFNAAGQLSFSFSSGADNRINTDAIDLLTLANVSANGGFTMSTHFKTSQTAGFGQFLAYAGTDGFRIRDGAVEYFALDPNVTNSSFINLETLAGTDLQDNAWHQVTVTFDTLGNPIVGDNIAGEYKISINGTNYAGIDGFFHSFGESLDRSIGVGGRSAGGDQYAGLVYNPSVALGIPEPSTSLLAGIATLALAFRRRR